MEDKTDRLEEERNINDKLTGVTFFPGSIAEYEKVVGYKVRVVRTRSRDWGICFQRSYGNNYAPPRFRCIEDLKVKKDLVEDNIEALVNSQFSFSRVNDYIIEHRYGLPVTRDRHFGGGEK